MMTLIRDNAGSTAWVVGQFDEIRRRMRLPSGVAGQVPPMRLVSVKANINGGIKATIRAEAGDKAAADQLRDVVRGFISLARLQAGAKAGAREHAQDRSSCRAPTRPSGCRSRSRPKHFASSRHAPAAAARILRTPTPPARTLDPRDASDPTGEVS